MLSKLIAKLFSNFYSKLLLPFLIWLTIKRIVFFYKRILRLQVLLLNKLKCQLRLLNPSSQSEGFDANFDKIVHIAAFKLSNPEIFDLDVYQFLFQGSPESLIKNYQEIVLDYEKHKTDIDQLITNAIKDPRIRTTIEKRFLVKSFFSIQKKDERASDYYLAQAKQYNPDAIVIDAKIFFELEKTSKKEFCKLMREISDKEAFKIAFSLEKIGTLLSIVSAFFLITGYLYNNFLLGHFGIDVSKYFTLSDYLASSIEGIRYSALGAVMGLVGYFIGMHNSSRKSYAQIERERERKDYVPYLLLVLSTTMALISYLKDVEQFYFFLYLSILMFTLMIAPLISKYYFKEPIVALFAIVFVVSFSASLYESIGKEIHRLKHKSIEDLKRYEISFKDKFPFQPSNVTLIAANSTYLFLLDENRNVYIVPRERINYVTLYKKPNKSLQPMSSLTHH